VSLTTGSRAAPAKPPGAPIRICPDG